MIDAFLLLIDIFAMLVLLGWSLAQDRAAERSRNTLASRQAGDHSPRHH